MRFFIVLTLCLYASIMASCSHQTGTDQRRPADEASGKQLYQWMQTRVEMMVRHKASCSDMAQTLIKSQNEARTQLKKWRAQGAGEWLKLHAQHNQDFDKELTRLISKGDLVYYHCAYQESFRNQLANGADFTEP